MSYLHYITIFLVSLLCLSLELFFTRILNLKTWNHVVYIIIPYAVLGYGIGANLCLIFKNRLRVLKTNTVTAILLLLITGSSLICTLSLIHLPVEVDYLLNIFVSLKAIFMLLLAYTIIIVPFILIGFFVVYLFLEHPTKSHTLYFWDLVGAGLGAFLFTPLIYSMQVVHSIMFLCLLTFLICLFIIFQKKAYIVSLIVILWAGIGFMVIPEPHNYRIDKGKGWEWIPGFFKSDQYEQIVSRWHPLGRTDIFKITGEDARYNLYKDSVGTFEINLEPLPEFSYVSTNFLAGTPIYNLSPEGLAQKNSQVKLFSQAMEFPYTLLKNPRVLVIGAGGGRDIFMANTHAARHIVGAEINPGIHTEMSPGGKYYEYSGKAYTLTDTKIFNIDGRLLTKQLSPGSVDLIILNGVDTFSGLSTGAYAYAESYLYTKEALLDYLHALDQGGMINFNRWLFPIAPREELRLFAIALDALKTLGAQTPEDHIIIGGHQRWALILIKKTPFSPEEKAKIFQYFKDHDTMLIFPKNNQGTEISPYEKIFDVYLENFKEGRAELFNHFYPYDVSVVTDENPFFYKYYKWNSFNPFQVDRFHHTGTIIFLTQALILIQGIIFIVLFIFLPLYILKKSEIKMMPKDFRSAMIIFFSCLGCGFMFIEIPLMQRFVLLLGSPIYSISTTLAFLLIFLGVGSLLLPHLQRLFKTTENLITVASFLLIALILALIAIGIPMLDHLVHLSFLGRVLAVCVMLCPIGILLGVFFPAGLQLIGKNYNDAIAWAWGINCGFSVLGSILAIILGQFLGFNTILLAACVIYLLAVLAFRTMGKVNFNNP